MNKSALAAITILLATSPAIAGGTGNSSGAGVKSLGGGWTMPRSGGFEISRPRSAWTRSPNVPVPDRDRKIPRPSYAFERTPRCAVLVNPALLYPIASYPSGQYCGTRVFVGTSIYALPWLPRAEATMFPLTVEF